MEDDVAGPTQPAGTGCLEDALSTGLYLVGLSRVEINVIGSVDTEDYLIFLRLLPYLGCRFPSHADPLHPGQFHAVQAQFPDVGYAGTAVGFGAAGRNAGCAEE